MKPVKSQKGYKTDCERKKPKQSYEKVCFFAEILRKTVTISIFLCSLDRLLKTIYPEKKQFSAIFFILIFLHLDCANLLI